MINDCNKTDLAEIEYCSTLAEYGHCLPLIDAIDANTDRYKDLHPHAREQVMKGIHKIKSAQEVAVNARSRLVRDDIDPCNVQQVHGPHIFVEEQQEIMDRFLLPGAGPGAVKVVNTGYDSDNDFNNNATTFEEVRDAQSLLNAPILSQLT